MRGNFLTQCIFIPIGSYEQHGPHLPPETDYLIAYRISQELSSLLKGKTVEGIKIGISPEHEGFRDTKSNSPKKFTSQVKEILNKYSDNNILIIINAHGGNTKQLNGMKTKQERNILILNTFSLIKEDLIKLRTSEIGGIGHAGEFETSLMLYLYPENVNLENLKRSDVCYCPDIDPNYQGKKLTIWKTKDFSESGILGDPFHGTVSKGKLWFECLVKRVHSAILEFITQRNLIILEDLNNNIL